MKKEQIREIFSIPNVLSWIRLLLVPVYWVLFFSTPKYWVVVVFVLASVTDCLDGWIARKFSLITDVGKVLDPLADKCMQISALLSLTIDGYINWYLTVIMFLKELFMIVSCVILYNKKVVVSANFVGKAATVLMILGIVTIFSAAIMEDLMIGAFDEVLKIGTYILCAAIGVSVMAAVIYTHITVKQLHGKLPDGKEKINIKF